MGITRFSVAQRWLARGRKRPRRRSTTLLWRKQKPSPQLPQTNVALWNLGIENPASFSPGNIAFADPHGFKFKPVKTLTYAEPTPISLDEAATRLQVLLEESIRRRTHGVKEVAVAFSGGLDSSIVAYIATKLGVTVNLLHVSMENQPETEEAIDASNQAEFAASGASV